MEWGWLLLEGGRGAVFQTDFHNYNTVTGFIRQEKNYNSCAADGTVWHRLYECKCTTVRQKELGLIMMLGAANTGRYNNKEAGAHVERVQSGGHVHCYGVGVIQIVVSHNCRHSTVIHESCVGGGCLTATCGLCFSRVMVKHRCMVCLVESRRN